MKGSSTILRTFHLIRKVSVLFLISLIACVDRIDIDDEGEFAPQVVIDGFISDDSGPYTIRLFRSSSVEDNLSNTTPFSAKTVTILDNLGNSEILSETSVGSGVYVTSPTGIQGVLGRSYTLRIEFRDGKIYESVPELIRPPGAVDTIYHVFETYVPLEGPTEYGYRIYMDSHGDSDNKYFRWRFNGTYRIETNPEQRTVPFGEGRIPDPPPCSGYIYNGELQMVGECTCCTCWVTETDNIPNVSDNQFVTGDQFKRIEVGYVSINEFTFFDRYEVEVEQLSLSKEAFDFWKSIKSQKEGSTSLFQPSFGEVKTNIHPVNGGPPVLGIFYASGKARKSIFIKRDDVPFIVPPLSAAIPNACNVVFDNASTTKPPGW